MLRCVTSMWGRLLCNNVWVNTCCMADSGGKLILLKSGSSESLEPDWRVLLPTYTKTNSLRSSHYITISKAYNDLSVRISISRTCESSHICAMSIHRCTCILKIEGCRSMILLTICKVFVLFVSANEFETNVSHCFWTSSGYSEMLAPFSQYSPIRSNFLAHHKQENHKNISLYTCIHVFGSNEQYVPLNSCFNFSALQLFSIDSPIVFAMRVKWPM